MRYLMLVLACAALVAAQEVTIGPEAEAPSADQQPAAVASVGAASAVIVLSGRRIDVQRDAILRELIPAEKAAITAYMAAHGGDGSCENQRALRNAIEFLTRIDQSHFRLSRSPKDYLADYQIFTQALGRVDWYVRIPEQRLTVALRLPPFQPGQPVLTPPLTLTPGVPTPGPNLQQVSIELIELKERKTTVCRTIAAAPCATVMLNKSGLAPSAMPHVEQLPGMAITASVGWLFGVKAPSATSSSSSSSSSTAIGGNGGPGGNGGNGGAGGNGGNGGSCPPLPPPPPSPVPVPCPTPVPGTGEPPPNPPSPPGTGAIR